VKNSRRQPWRGVSVVRDERVVAAARSRHANIS
jgi:hypothetical protein